MNRRSSADLCSLLHRVEDQLVRQREREEASRTRIRNLVDGTTALEKKCLLLFHQIDEMRDVIAGSEEELSHLRDVFDRLRHSYAGIRGAADEVTRQSGALKAEANAAAVSADQTPGPVDGTGVQLFEEAMNSIRRLQETIRAH